LSDIVENVCVVGLLLASCFSGCKSLRFITESWVHPTGT